MASITIPLTPAPDTPLNLRLGVMYAPRLASPPVVGFRATEYAPNVFQIEAVNQAGVLVPIYSGDLFGAYIRLAEYLRMDEHHGISAERAEEIKNEFRRRFEGRNEGKTP